MANQKQVRKAPDNRKRKKKKKFLTRRGPGFKSGILAVVMLVAVAYLLIQLVKINLFPFYIILPVIVLFGAGALLLDLLWFAKARTPLMRTLCFILAAALTVTGFVGGAYLSKTSGVFENITNLTDNMVHTVSVVAFKDSGCSSVKDLNGAVVGTVSADDPEGTQMALDQLEQSARVTVQNYDSVLALTEAFFDREVDAIILPEEDRGIIHDAEEYISFNTTTDILDQVTYYTERNASEINEADPVKNITRDAFTILVSGNDSYGSLEGNARSDVNMLVTVDPATHVVLLTSIPRDTYVEVTCKKDTSACSSWHNAKDKLTHTGLEGVGTTESSIEDFMGIDINYTVRVNFSSLVGLVDALGGIDVFVEDGLAVETFYVNGTQGVEEGWNHLEGERALAFARERYAYLDGDNQRIRNQSIVMNALIQKVASPEIFVRYPALMDAMGIAFETNIPTSQIKDLVRFEITERPDWQIISYAIAGEPSLEYSPKLGQNASVTIPDDSMVQTAVEAIQAVLDGKSAADVEAICDANRAYAAGSYSVEEQEEIINPYTVEDDYSYDYGYGYDLTKEDYDPYGVNAYGTYEEADGFGYGY